VTVQYCSRVPDSELKSARTFGLRYSGAVMAFFVRYSTVGRPGELRYERFDFITVARGTLQGGHPCSTGMNPYQCQWQRPPPIISK
jgi:hypothetical protein